MTRAPVVPWRAVAVYAGPPVAWMVHLLVSYALVPPACDGSTVPLHVATVVLAGVATGCTVLALRGSPGGRTTGVVLGALFSLVILLQGAANALVDPCA